MIFVIDCESDRLTCRLMARDGLEELAGAAVRGIGQAVARLEQRFPGRPAARGAASCPDHHRALTMVLRSLREAGFPVPEGIAAVAHRVRHGGKHFHRSVRINAQVLALLREDLLTAPHNRANLAGIEAAFALLPAVPQTATFDTAFHQHMPRAASYYPLPGEWHEKHGIRRYGFDGPAHRHALQRAARWLGKSPATCNLISVHEDAGISLCAIRDGVSIDTSMGFTPTEGIPGETCSGDIDPGILYFMMQQESLAPRQFAALLQQQSGLRGVSGRSGVRRELATAAAGGDERCRLALAMEEYRLRKYLGAYWAVVGLPDILVFSLGREAMGWLLRKEVLRGLEFLGIRLAAEEGPEDVREREVLVSAAASSVPVLLVPAGGERVIAGEAAVLLAGGSAGGWAEVRDFARPGLLGG